MLESPRLPPASCVEGSSTKKAFVIICHLSLLLFACKAALGKCTEEGEKRQKQIQLPFAFEIFEKLNVRFCFHFAQLHLPTASPKALASMTVLIHDPFGKLSRDSNARSLCGRTAYLWVDCLIGRLGCEVQHVCAGALQMSYFTE